MPERRPGPPSRPLVLGEQALALALLGLAVWASDRIVAGLAEAIDPMHRSGEARLAMNRGAAGAAGEKGR